MTTPRKFNDATRRQVVQLYEQWKVDPGGDTIESLARGLGMTRATFYDILEEKGVQLTRKVKRTDKPGSEATDLVDGMARNALVVMLEQLYELKQKCNELEAENAELLLAAQSQEQRVQRRIDKR